MTQGNQQQGQQQQAQGQQQPEDQSSIVSCHARRKGITRSSVLRAPSSFTASLATLPAPEISSLMAHANVNRSRSPPASGCSRARSNRHILLSSKAMSRSASLVSDTTQDLLCFAHSMLE